MVYPSCLTAAVAGLKCICVNSSMDLIQFDSLWAVAALCSWALCDWMYERNSLLKPDKWLKWGGSSLIFLQSLDHSSLLSRGEPPKSICKGAPVLMRVGSMKETSLGEITSNLSSRAASSEDLLTSTGNIKHHFNLNWTSISFRIH